MNKLKFIYKQPEETGISSDWIVNFLTRLENCGLPMHSMILMKDEAIVAETYYAPYTKDTKHRMFSITKSFVSIAIGLLEADGKLHLDDTILSYFPEKLAGKEPHPYLASLTIRDMLKMSTCHAKTTYKFEGCDDWTGSFFTTPPSHVPGTTFSYDTSSTHTLCALAEKLTGQKLLDYLRDKFLKDAGFSKDAYILENEQGESLGGSGLMATPMDILRFMYIISKGGVLNGKQVLPADYIKAATAKQIDTFAKSSTWEEMQGYGYQFWRTTHNGFACYGMGGQYAIYYPDYNVLLVTTADTQGRAGGTQLIYDAFYQEVLDRLERRDTFTSSISAKDFKHFLTTRSLPYVKGALTSPILSGLNGHRYVLDKNPMGFRWVALSIDKHDQGSFDYETDKGVFSLPFSLGCNELIQFPYYNYQAAASGAFLDTNTFLIKAHLVDECVGNVWIQLVFKDNEVTLMMRKVEETMFKEFDGFVSGHKA